MLDPQDGLWGHFGHINVILDATWGPRGAIRLDLGVIVGSISAQFRDQNDIKFNVKKTWFSGDVVFDMLVVVGVPFGIYLENFLCLETIHDEKGEHVICDDGCTFSHNCQGPEGSENDIFQKTATSWDRSFYGHRFVSQNDHLGGHFREPFGLQKWSEMTSEMAWSCGSVLDRCEGSFNLQEPLCRKGVTAIF